MTVSAVISSPLMLVDGNTSVTSAEPLVARQMSIIVVVNRICFMSLSSNSPHGKQCKHICRRSSRTDSPKFQNMFQNKF